MADCQAYIPPMAQAKVPKIQSTVLNVAPWSWVMTKMKMQIGLQNATVIMARMQMLERKAACRLCEPLSKRSATKLRHHAGYCSARVSAAIDRCNSVGKSVEDSVTINQI